MTAKTTAKPAAKKTARARKRQSVGESIIQGLKEAIAWTRGENDNVRVTLVDVPEVDVRKVRLKMGLSQAQFATKQRPPKDPPPGCRLRLHPFLAARPACGFRRYSHECNGFRLHWHDLAR
jgi:hypothetical protein